MQFKSEDHLFWWIFVGSKGGKMRLKIIKLIMDQGPLNANQLSKILNVNYRTIMHHLNVLTKNNLIISDGPRYGQIYSASKFLIQNKSLLNKIICETGEIKC
ncbi:winged helix-turn-helix domain-containing protein [Caldisphaera sp.]|uniref:winged helix-turn-helix domain-containing protein n=1 Tax=Caldisphaera sp. TaxID=2060322 RepID=UPI003D0A8D4E